MEFKKLKLEPTFRKKQDEFIPVDFFLSKTGNDRPYSLDANEEYELSSVFSIKFWANQTQFDGSLALAKKTLIRNLFNRYFYLLQQLEMAISNGEKLKSLELCEQMREEMESI